MSTFQTIKTLAKQKGLSLQKLAAEANLSQNTIYSWKYKNPSMNNLKAVAEILNVSTEYLLGKKEIEHPKKTTILNNQEVDLKELFDEGNIKQRTISYDGQPISDHDMDLIKSILSRIVENG